VQGRYLTPMLPLVYMVLSPDGVHNRMNKRAWHLTLALSQAALWIAVCAELMMQYHA